MGTEDSRNGEAERCLEQFMAAIREGAPKSEQEYYREIYYGALAAARRPSDR